MPMRQKQNTFWHDGSFMVIHCMNPQRKSSSRYRRSVKPVATPEAEWFSIKMEIFFLPQATTQEIQRLAHQDWTNGRDAQAGMTSERQATRMISVERS